MNITLYTFEDVYGREKTFATQDEDEARAMAKANGWKCLALVYEYVSTDTLCDCRFTDT